MSEDPMIPEVTDEEVQAIWDANDAEAMLEQVPRILRGLFRKAIKAALRDVLSQTRDMMLAGHTACIYCRAKLPNHEGNCSMVQEALSKAGPK